MLMSDIRWNNQLEHIVGNDVVNFVCLVKNSKRGLQVFTQKTSVVLLSKLSQRLAVIEADFVRNSAETCQR